MKEEPEKFKKLLFTNIKTTYLIAVITVTLGIIAIYYSYAIFSISVEKKGVLNVAAANLYPAIKSDALNSSNQVTVAAGGTLQFEVEIENINSVDAKYVLYYKEIDRNQYYEPRVGIAESTRDTSIVPAGFTINKYGSNNTKKATIVLDNSYSFYPVTLEFGVKVGMTGKDIILNSDEILLEFTSSLPNPPELVGKMVPIVYSSGNNWKVKKIDSTLYGSSDAYYSYSNRIWANAMTSDDSKYLTAAVNTTVPMSDIRTMWVWIPRFEYKINGTYGTHLDGTAGTASNPGAIDINFIGADVITPKTGYRIHPAFTFNGKQLAGIWVSKFVTGGTMSTSCGTTLSCFLTDIVIKPDVPGITNQKLGVMISLANHMTWAGMGFSDTDGVHVMKNNEWGAVAYLSQSKYGKYADSNFTGTNKRVYMNDSSTFYTGRTSGTPSASGSVLYGTYSYNGVKCSSDPECTGTITSSNSGTGASTTGNISGVYDTNTYILSTYVMGNYNQLSSSADIYSLSTTWWNDNKHLYDYFNSTTLGTACAGSACYGQALSETNGWFSATSNWSPTDTNSWLLRGGGSNFRFYFNNGGPGHATRMSIAPQS